ncbi:transglycosylase SLT domain-containing protein [Dyella acidisoli]|uniref:transglycosylase SLT domain-containing protein n=1 Tax=Dyella acidisoli TaxID=1867834 RepID=UPI0024E05104|nr:transglycosylase SLT domain-containing protein [Dyella acidisoli]
MGGSEPVMRGNGAPSRQEVTQRVYLCAPAAFRARRLGGPVEKVLIAAPCGWARQRRITQRHRRAAETAKGLSGLGALTALPSWQAKLSFDTPHWLPVIKQQAQMYRVPIISGLGLAAGTAAVAIGIHAWHASANTPLAVRPANVTKPLAVAAPVRPSVSFADVTGAVVSVPARRMALTKPKESSTSTLGLASDGTIVVVAEPRAVHTGGFDLDITSPSSLWVKAGARYRIDPVLIYAVALVETRGTQPDGSVAPSPWIVRINGHLHSGSRAETEHAIELAHLLAVPVQDVGIMQVYYPVHRDIEPDPIALLNPARNIEIGTRLLRKAMGESSDPVLRIGYYHSHDATLARGYGELVLNVYKELKMAMGRSPSRAVALASTKTAQSGG